MEKLKDIPDNELEDLIDGGLNAARYGGSMADAKSAPIYLAEKSRRSSEKSSNTTLTTSKRTFWTAITALVIALAAMTFSVIDFFGDKSWKQEQLEVLKKIQNNTKLEK